jgi:hypothetical protein
MKNREKKKKKRPNLGISGRFVLAFFILAEHLWLGLAWFGTGAGAGAAITNSPSAILIFSIFFFFLPPSLCSLILRKPNNFAWSRPFAVLGSLTSCRGYS